MKKEPEIDNFAVGQRLEMARIAAGYKKPTDAARALGINASTYRNTETGLRSAGEGRLAYYASRFGVSLLWLYTGVGRGPHEDKEIHARIGELYQAIEDFADWDSEDQVSLLSFLKGLRRERTTDASPTS